MAAPPSRGVMLPAPAYARQPVHHADIAIFPWVRNLVDFYGAGDLVEFTNYPDVARVLASFLARPAVQRGLTIPG